MAELILLNQGSAITWPSAGHAITLPGLAGAGRQGQLHNFGTGARARRFAWRAWIRCAQIPDGFAFAPNGQFSVYLKTSDGLHPDTEGTADLPLDPQTDATRRLLLLKVLDFRDPTAEQVLSGTVEINAQFVAPVILAEVRLTPGDRVFLPLTSNAADHGFSLTPVPDEIQGI